MKKICIAIICLFFCIVISAELVTFEEAHIIATNWAKNLKTFFNDDVTILSGESIVKESITVAYVFHFSPRGYLIVSAEDYLPPIKMYSLKNNFRKEGKSLEDFIFNQFLEIIKNVKLEVIDPKKYFMEKNRKDVKLLIRKLPLLKKITSSDITVKEVKPLLSTTWYQREPYNLKCPVINDRRCVTGCVATAFAQIMKYHEYPSTGRGSWSYQTYTNNINVSASFDHPYYWDLMLDNYPTPESGTEEQREAISQLMFDVGVSFSMDYSPDGSGANTATSVIIFPIFFKYSANIICIRKRGMDDTEWFDLAKNHVDKNLPVAFAIYDLDVGHAVVVDGYRISSGSTTFHINMGWGGSWDGYYSLNNIIVRDGKYHFTVLDNQAYVLNIIPPDSETELPSLNFGAVAHENKSLFLKEYFCEIRWKGFSPETEDIDGYDIVKYDINTLEKFNLARVDHTGQSLYQYTFRIPEFIPDVYYVYAVTKEGKRKSVMSCNLVLKESNSKNGFKETR